MLLGGDGCVDSLGVELEEVELFGGEDGDGAVGGGAKLEDSLGAVVLEEVGAEDFGEGSRGVAAEGFHLPKAVLSGDEALGEDEIVEGGGADVGDALGVALHGDGSGESGDGDGAVELREIVAHDVVGPGACGVEEDDEEQEERGEAEADDFGEDGGLDGLVVRLGHGGEDLGGEQLGGVAEGAVLERGVFGRVGCHMLGAV